MFSPSLADQHLLQHDIGLCSSHAETPSRAVGHLLQDDIAMNDIPDSGMDLTKDRHLLCRSPVDSGSFETERVKLPTEQVPTVDELAEVDLGDQ